MYFTRNGTSYWYEIEGEGKPVVLLHGFTGDSGTWSRFVSEWKHEFKLLVIDLPGHGKTVSERSVTMEACCADLAGLFAELGLHQVHILGYSMGGRTALSFAMLHPEKVSSMTLESTSPGLNDEKERTARVNRDEQLAKRLERDGIVAFVDFWENIPLFQTQKKLPEMIRQSIRDERLSQSAAGLAMSLRSMGTGIQPSWWDRLEELKLPVLLIAGAYDNKFVGINKIMVNHMPEADLMVVEKAGHAIHVEQPQFFGKIVIEFLQSIS
ncbi:2-succinyl-6-hydroxy-2,4-cyclohexadiene-1-carboxylate synthase [Virgibacillus siamensis]|uniref:2-succinyl-6-hydroxy-2, 4-cyclohexadiene-1-carboxylate synthase n=1 Tax=Virgibacillus siamensis TaxID=480071 RepID=UPI0009876DC1|nr:2-succinyl-6-hydroxy-2,4-cyclohexadiene-1-carboxylate synthase [Virgibacillus siamensis]